MTEVLAGWEDVASPIDTPSPPSSDQHRNGSSDGGDGGGRDWEMVLSSSPLTRNGNHEDDDVFPPSRHEGLPILHISSHYHQFQSQDEQEEGQLRQQQQQQQQQQQGDEPIIVAGPPLDGIGGRLLRTWESAACRLSIGGGAGLFFDRVLNQSRLWWRRWVVGAHGGGGRALTWPFAALALVLSLAMLLLQQLRRRRYRREIDRLRLLVQLKDQKINQLLHQLAQMQEITSGRRRVFVFRRA
ncbi:hypothetical protein QJS04_geneDACA007912 [Acorus gramineus]|uniref:Uncharacterized protein n=1 Tax=Acorus gramineus TaxID=55184 RepID=A0AAV9BA85_ACOGR|nr:hypothetical protein QJS04_geneDACA007912 [Acorus gramineus]